MIQPRLTETAGYTAKREELRQAERELIEHAERVAALRRELPIGSTVTDYVFREADTPASTVRLSELFTSSAQPLVISERGIDLLSPVWNILDLTPQGRGDWYAKLGYPGGAQDG